MNKIFTKYFSRNISLNDVSKVGLVIETWHDSQTHSLVNILEYLEVTKGFGIVITQLLSSNFT